MRKGLLYILPIIFALCSISNNDLLAQGRQRIAVMDFNANNVSKYISKAVSEMIGTEMAKKGDLQIIERAQMGQIMEEQGLQMTGCTDSTCAVQVGKLLSARKILIGTVSKLGNTFSIVSRVVDVEHGSVDFAESERCAKEDDIEQAARILAVKMVNRIANKNYSIPSRTYETEEQRRRFYINAGFRYGIMPGLKVPFIDPKTPKMTSQDNNTKIMIGSIGPNYEINNYLSIESSFRYARLKLESMKEDSYTVEGSTTFGSTLVNETSFSGYGFNVSAKFTYPMRGFVPFINLGGSYYFYQLKQFPQYLTYNSNTWQFYSNGTDSAQAYYLMKYKESVQFFSIESFVGITVFISPFVDLVIAAGSEIPIAGELFDDITLEKKYSYVAGTPPEQYKSLSNEFKGNFPPIYFMQVGVNFRIM